MKTIIVCPKCSIEVNDTRKARRGYCFRCYKLLLSSGEISKLLQPMPDKLTEYQNQLMIGHLLGDSHLQVNASHRSINARLRINRSIKDKDYLLWEKPVWKDFCTDKCVREHIDFHKNWNKNYSLISFETRAASVFTEYHKKWYKDGIKIVPKDLYLTPTILMIWFMDDGCVYYGKHGNINFKLSTEGFVKSEVLFLCNLLIDRYGSNFNLSLRNKDKDMYAITAHGKSAFNFLNEIDPIVPECMNRKSNIWRNPPSRKMIQTANFNIKNDLAFEYISKLDASYFYAEDLYDYIGYSPENGRDYSLLNKYIGEYIHSGLIQRNRINTQSNRVIFILTDKGKVFFRTVKK